MDLRWFDHDLSKCRYYYILFNMITNIAFTIASSNYVLLSPETIENTSTKKSVNKPQYII